MRIGELPEASSPTSSYKAAVESGTGNSFHVTLEKLCAALQKIGAPLAGYAGRSTLFSAYDNTAATITDANLYYCFQMRQLEVTLTLKTDLSFSATGVPTAFTTLGKLKSQYYPAMTYYGTAVKLDEQLFGVAYVDTFGNIQIRHMDARGTAFTLPADSTIRLSFYYLGSGRI